MPYYRIKVWTKRRKAPYSGIRMQSNPNINSVYSAAESKAKQLYRQDFIDIEVQMLSKLCTAVKEFEKKDIARNSFLLP